MTRDFTTRLRPWDPIFDTETNYGTVIVGNTPSGWSGFGFSVQSNQIGLGSGSVSAGLCDDFNRADSTSLGVNWVESGDGDLQIISNELTPGSGSSTTRRAWWVTAMGFDDHFVEALVDADGPISLYARADSTTPSDAIECRYTTASGGTIVLYNNADPNSGTVGSDMATVTGVGSIAGKTLKLEVEDVWIRAKIDNVPIISARSVAITTGEYVGLRLDGTGAGSPNVDNFCTGLITPAGALSGAYPAALMALGPLSYWPLQGSNDVTSMVDYGSLGLDLAENATGVMDWDVIPGGDGFNYPRRDQIASTSGHLVGADDVAYEPQNAGGLTVVYLVRSQPGGNADLPHLMGKFDSGGGGSWRMNYTTAVSATAVSAAILTTTGDARRSRVSEYTADAWQLVVNRFSSSGTAFPAIRRDGSNLSVTTNGSGTGQSNSTQPVRLFGHGGSTGPFPGSLAHVAIYAGQLSDGDCATLEAAAASDGW